MKHPLINPSLTPHGFGVGNTYKRSSWKSDERGCFNRDWGAARYWQQSNLLSNAFRPAEHIIHEIMPGMRTLGRTIVGDFEFAGKLYQSADIALLSGIATWLGTNIGNAMLYNNLFNAPGYTATNEFRVRWRECEKPQSEGHLLRHLLHECSPHTCAYGRNSCSDYSRDATEREVLVRDAFLFWLGQKTGREYLHGFEVFMNTTSRNIWEGYKQRRDQERQLRRQTQSAS